MNFTRGSAVVVQNADNRGFFYIVKSGLLQVDSEHRLNDKELSRFGPGDSFGLVSALTGQKFLVTVFAAADSVVIELPVADFGNFLKKQPSLAMGMLRLYANELKAIHKHLSMVNPAGLRSFSPSRLLTQAEVYLALDKPELAARGLQFFLQWSADKPELAEERRQAQEKLSHLAAQPVPQQTGNVLQLETGQVVFLENEISNDIFVIKSGHIRLSTLAKGQELLIDILGPGEIFGEMSFVDSGIRMATAVAGDRAEVMKFSPETLFDNVGEVILQKIFISLARRIWFSHQRLVILRLTDPVARLYAFLYNLIRNSEINSSTPGKKDNLQFNLGLEELKKMCGLAKINSAKLDAFAKDTNLLITPDSITIKDRKYVEDKISFFKTKVGQISAELV